VGIVEIRFGPFGVIEGSGDGSCLGEYRERFSGSWVLRICITITIECQNKKEGLQGEEREQRFKVRGAKFDGLGENGSPRKYEKGLCGILGEELIQNGMGREMARHEIRRGCSHLSRVAPLGPITVTQLSIRLCPPYPISPFVGVRC
jgi:hypothetical protein